MMDTPFGRWSTLRTQARALLPSAGILLAGCIGALVVGVNLEQSEQARTAAIFRATTTGLFDAVRDDTVLAMERLSAAQAFLTAYPGADPQAFHDFVARLPGIRDDAPMRAIALAPRLPVEAHAAFLAGIADEAAVRERLDYPAFDLRPAPTGPVGYPTFYVEPPQSRDGVLGYDMGSNPDRLEAIRRAIRTRSVIASAPIRLSQDTDHPRASVLLVAPLFDTAQDGACPAGHPWWHEITRADGEDTHLGVVAMGYSPTLSLANLPPQFGSHLSVTLWDGGIATGGDRPTPRPPPTAPDDPRLLFAVTSTGLSAPDALDGFVTPELMEPMVVAGRVWWMGVHGLDSVRPWSSRAIPPALAAAILVGALALSALVHRILTTQEALRQGVAARTRDLEHTNIALRLSQARAESANAAKTQFLAAMSHELRTPLNAIIGFAEMLRGGVGLGMTEQDRWNGVRRYAEYILSAGESLLSQLERILDLSRIETGRLAVSPDSLDLAPAVEAGVALIQPVAEARSVTLRVDIASALPPALADIRAMHQIIENLLSNAIKFSRPKGTVSVRLMACDPDGDAVAPAHPAGHVALVVEDEGIGIPAEHLSRVTDPFHQVADQMTREHAGLGLGLAIVKELVESQNGRLMLESTEGRGTVVRVILPVARGTRGI